MSDQESSKKKGLTKKRRKGLGLLRHRNGHSTPEVLDRAKALNAAYLRGVPSFAFPDPPPWHPPNQQSPAN